MISVSDLMCERDDRVLFNNINFSLNKGELLHVMGANGAGKSSLLNIIVGLLEPTAGNVKWLEKPIVKIREFYYQQLLYIPHKIGVHENLTPFENLQLFVGRYKQVDNKVLIAALREWGLQWFDDVLCRQLSQGQKKRVALAQLSIVNPKLWILDEPFNSIDEQGVKLLNVKIADHLQDGGVVILSSHQQVNLPVSKRIEIGDISE